MTIMWIEIECQEKSTKYAHDLVRCMHVRKLHDFFLFNLLIKNVQCLSGLEYLRLEFTALKPSNALVPTRIQCLQARGGHVHSVGILAS